MFATIFYKRFRKACPQCNTVVHAMDGVGEPENPMKHRKALLSEDKLLVRKERDNVCEVSERA